MNNDLLFDFTVDKNTKTVLVNKAFAAPQQLVWDAFTTQELLDQWWAPKPWQSKTKHMHFEEGGRRLYAMVGPEGQEHWSIQEFKDIYPITQFSMFSAFTDAQGAMPPNTPSSHWHLAFEEAGGITTVRITITHTSLAHMETMIAMGFQGGFTMTLNYLETLLNTLAKKGQEAGATPSGLSVK